MIIEPNETLRRELSESREMLEEYRQKYDDSERQISELKAELDKLAHLNEIYLERIKLMAAEKYAPKSERYMPIEGQTVIPEYFNEAEVTGDPVAPEIKPEEFEEITYRRRKAKGKRAADLSNLPKRKDVYRLPEEDRVCPECGHDHMAEIGQSHIRTEIEYIPAQCTVVEIYSEAYECTCCKENGIKDSIIKAATPKPLINKSGLASPSLAAAVMYNKFSLGLPLARQEQDFDNLGYPITRQNMANWVIYCADKYLRRLFDQMRLILLAFWVIYADETKVQVHREKGRANTTQSFMWVYRSGDYEEQQMALFEYTTTRAAEHPRRFLSGYQNYLQVDGYDVYHGIDGVTCSGCWSHCRREFFDIVKANKKSSAAYSLASKGVDFIDQLFKIEDKYKDLSASDKLTVRQEQSKPVVTEFFSWVNENLTNVPPKSLIGKALQYATNQKLYLLTYLEDGRLNISSNAIERSIRPFANHRHAWLFCDSPRGAEASAICYSIVETAKLNNLIPFEYLKYVLFELSQRSANAPVLDLLPWSLSIPEHCKHPTAPNT